MSRPPPPPPPPPLPTHLSKRSNPAGQANLPAPVPQAQAGPRRNAGEADVVGEPFRPCHMFFYGSLMDPEVIQAVLALPDLPTTQAASISGFRVRMWGPYPTLLPSSAGTVLGRVWKVTSEEHFNRLAEYETAAYRWVECDAVLDDGTGVRPCRTFCWAGDPDSRDLEDGSFNLAYYQMYFKPSVVRR